MPDVPEHPRPAPSWGAIVRPTAERFALASRLEGMIVSFDRQESATMARLLREMAEALDRYQAR